MEAMEDIYTVKRKKPVLLYYLMGKAQKQVKETFVQYLFTFPSFHMDSVVEMYLNTYPTF